MPPLPNSVLYCQHFEVKKESEGEGERERDPKERHATGKSWGPEPLDGHECGRKDQ